MEIKHTPGPWNYIGNGDVVARSDKYCGGEKDIASVFLTVNDEDEANARLIAQAPTLLAELKNARAFIQEHHDSFVESCTNLATGLIDDYDDILTAEASQDLLNGIDDAIAKATGGRA